MKKIIFTAVLLIIVGIVGGGYMLYQGANLSYSGKSFEIQREQASDNVQSIIVDSDSANITIDRTSNNKIQASLTGPESGYTTKDLSMSLQNQTLQIVEKDKDAPNGWFDIFSVKKSLELHIHLPEKLYDQLVIQSENGNIDMRDFHGNVINVSAKNGNMDLQKTAGTFSLESENGNIQVQSLSDFKGKNKAETQNGNIDIQPAQKPTSLQIDLHSEVGTVRSDYATTSESAGADQRIQTMIGSPTANQPTLQAHSQNGDITLGK